MRNKKKATPNYDSIKTIENRCLFYARFLCNHSLSIADCCVVLVFCFENRLQPQQQQQSILLYFASNSFAFCFTAVFVAMLMLMFIFFFARCTPFSVGFVLLFSVHCSMRFAVFGGQLWCWFFVFSLHFHRAVRTVSHRTFQHMISYFPDTNRIALDFCTHRVSIFVTQRREKIPWRDSVHFFLVVVFAFVSIHLRLID